MRKADNWDLIYVDFFCIQSTPSGPTYKINTEAEVDSIDDDDEEGMCGCVLLKFLSVDCFNLTTHSLLRLLPLPAPSSLSQSSPVKSHPFHSTRSPHSTPQWSSWHSGRTDDDDDHGRTARPPVSQTPLDRFLFLRDFFVVFLCNTKLQHLFNLFSTVSSGSESEAALIPCICFGRSDLPSNRVLYYY